MRPAPLVTCRLVSAVGVCLAACGGEAAPGASVAASASAAGVGDELPSRAEAVASADAIAVEAARVGGAGGASLSRRAAALRARLYRRERRDVDAREAIELERAAAEGAPASRCEPMLAAALLEGELARDPAAAYRAVSAARLAASAADPCARRAAIALSTLAAWRPAASAAAPPGVVGLGGDAAVAAASPSGAADATSPAGPPVPAGPSRLGGVERYGTEDAARVVLELSAPARYETGFLPAAGSLGPRLYVDLVDTSYRGKAELPGAGLVQRVRIGKQRQGTRVVLDLERAGARRVFHLPEPFRVVVDVARDAARAVAPAASAPTERLVRRVVLDPGHGGHDPGAVGPGGLEEKAVVLDVAHRAAPLLARELGISTLLTRDGDVFVPLPERTARANAYQADLFVSIHCNASEDASARGIMTFVLSPTADAASLHVAARENAASPAAAAELGAAFGGGMDAGALELSVRFAELLQRASVASLLPGYPGIPDGGVKRAGFYVLAGAHMPAVLFEAPFISNPVDETRLDSADFRQKLADAIVNAVRAYRERR
ncbi:MAG: N-acetylmuramoyl-L-alanine amidase [Polyangiaceae bacterium]|nr:N-acetylmuramoyl-L-alanine amidase [Polyangiaceae bacterium]